MPTQEQRASTTAEYASSGGLRADDINDWARGYDLGPDEGRILVALVDAVNGRRLTSPGQVTVTNTRREVKVTSGARSYVVRWYQNTVTAGPVRAKFDLGSEYDVMQAARDAGGSWGDVTASLNRIADNWSTTNRNRADATRRVALLALGTWTSRAAAVYRLGQQTDKADARAAELAAEQAAKNEAAKRRAKAFVRNPTSLDGSGAARMLDSARQVSPAVADRLLAKVSRITEEQPETSTAEAIEQAGTELAGEDSSVLDVLYPLAGPEYYQADILNLPAEWGLLFGSFVFPGATAPGDLPEASVYEASWPSLDRPWMHLLMHILYSDLST